jgi:hypothetical protein
VGTALRTEHLERAAVAAWRRRHLAEAGFPPRLAAALARDRRVDVHALIELVERGCRPELAARILAPLEVADGS